MPKKIDPKVKKRCVLEHLPAFPSLTSAAEAVARRGGLDKETVRRWVQPARSPLRSRTSRPRSAGSRWTKRSCAGLDLLREGYYDFGTGNGWGHFKIVYKHGIDKTRVWRNTMTATCGAPEQAGSTTWIYQGLWGLKECVEGGGCTVVDTVAARAFDAGVHVETGERTIVASHDHSRAAARPRLEPDVIAVTRRRHDTT